MVEDYWKAHVDALCAKNIMKDCSSSMIENEPLISIWKVKPTIVDTASVSVSQQLVHVVLKTLGYSHNKVRVHARLSSTEIAATAFLKRRDRYDTEKRRLFFFSVWDLLQRIRSERPWVFAGREPVVSMTELEEIQVIIFYSSSSGSIWWPQFRL